MLRPTVLVLTLLASTPAAALEVGDKATPFELKDVFGKTYTLGSFTKRILAVWYEGKNSYQQNTWLNERLRELKRLGNWPGPNVDSPGIVNYQETAVPNAIIDLMIKREWKRSRAIVLCDRDGVLLRTWGFRNGRSNIYVFDAQRVLIWKSSGPLTRQRATQFIRFLGRVSR
jgi:hypothetical protein